MRGNHKEVTESTEGFYACLEAYAREKIREWLQDLLDQEVTEVLGRAKSEKKRFLTPLSESASI